MFNESDIICYLNGRMDQTTALALKEEMKRNSDLADAVERIQLLQKMAKTFSTSQLRQEIEKSQNRLKEHGFFDFID